MKSSLLTAPTIKAVPCVKYVVEWDFEGSYWFDADQSTDTFEAHHRRIYLTKVAAYRHAAYGYIINRRHDRGCSKDKCAFGEQRYISAAGDTEDTRCRYCSHDKTQVIAKRLARWLKWRDARRAVPQEGKP